MFAVKETLTDELPNEAMNIPPTEEGAFWKEAVDRTKNTVSWIAHDAIEETGKLIGAPEEGTYNCHEKIDGILGTDFASQFNPEALAKQPDIIRGEVPIPAGGIVGASGRVAAAARTAGIIGGAAVARGALRETPFPPSNANSQLYLERQIREELTLKGYNPPGRPTGIPKDWKVHRCRKDGGVKYTSEIIKKDGTPYAKQEIRVMPANPNSSFEGHQRPYVKHRVENSFYDKNGNVVHERSLEAHIDYDEYDFEKISSKVEK
ncbi:hypothetical protein NEPTK9_001660 [Candidatus Neptunochlamydia vexilliferae]|uniref:Uncharacterized protein n=2 Tax=Candidatus Neptunichlamydia vexilliferae TaxID=1651774 RepID=A0ABS0B3F8_9BACT|nr:hypothetical protein [Candidatus Neptunochlamydia vexilliferae]